VRDSLRSDDHSESDADKFLVTAPPAGNVLTSVFKTLRRRRDPGYRNPNQTGGARQSSAQQDGSANPNEDEIIIAETKAALRACLVL
jgi:proton-dependent oligopeptide transporter, POT family